MNKNIQTLYYDLLLLFCFIFRSADLTQQSYQIGPDWNEMDSKLEQAGRFMNPKNHTQGLIKRKKEKLHSDGRSIIHILLD